MILNRIVQLTATCLLCALAFSVNAEEDREGVRVALFNIRELSTEKLTEVDGEGVGTNEQVLAAARIIQHIAPDILVINEIDHDYDDEENPYTVNGHRLIDNYLAHGENPISYNYIYSAPCNTGILTGIDLNGDGTTARDADRGKREHGDDSFGFGVYPGQYSMMVFSKFPILEDQARTFQEFLWKDMPDNLIPEDFYSEEAIELFRLSSKSHWDVPVEINGKTVHLLMSHPTPQGFDGEDDRNGRRNFDEVRLWAEYISGADWIYDDAGHKGGLAKDAQFIIIGDQNTGTGFEDPSIYNGKQAYELITDHPRVIDTTSKMTSRGAQERFGFNEVAAEYTFQWYGGSRIDYILPSKGTEVLGGESFWPSHFRDRKSVV